MEQAKYKVAFRYLTADEVECRVATCSEKGVSLLLYKDARADMKILDETVGPMGWQRKHELVNGNLFCTVSIFDEVKQEWVDKQDVGVESFTEKEKGQASDAFKRACVNWGIGRELYTAPFIWIGKDSVDLTQKNNKWTTYDKFEVRLMEVENGVITKLAIENTKKKKIVFTHGEAKPTKTTTTTTQPEQGKQPETGDKPQDNTSGDGNVKKLSEEQIKRLIGIAIKSDKLNGQPAENFLQSLIKKQLNKDSLYDMTKAEYDTICNWLEGK